MIRLILCTTTRPSLLAYYFTVLLSQKLTLDSSLGNIIRYFVRVILCLVRRMFRTSTIILLFPIVKTAVRLCAAVACVLQSKWINEPVWEVCRDTQSPRRPVLYKVYRKISTGLHLEVPCSNDDDPSTAVP